MSAPQITTFNEVFGQDSPIARANPNLEKFQFVPSEEPIPEAFITALKNDLQIELPSMFIDFINQCGGFAAGADFLYPSARKDGAICSPFVEFEFENRLTGLSLFEGFIAPGSNAYDTQLSTLVDCFTDDYHASELNGRDLRKLIPFVCENGDLLCLDYNDVNDGEPSIVMVTYDGVAITRVLDNFEAMLIAMVIR
ncbi:SMI1/KNR4 family protein [Vibrio sp. LaRot3]|uniref:SMI1/KNR4 family protein n=1 Tax=Vibrio sp. LaRot3 TaxID=2998829 RepID=UPI0022CE1379|nr:SMI1/KNR4 family protein [Vibrio sp. LaRot3]MDA0148282.1 SMI1/KNR4 family protein [Vibrio sp. LaRot3]